MFSTAPKTTKRKNKETEFIAEIEVNKKKEMDELDLKKQEEYLVLLQRRLAVTAGFNQLEKEKHERDMEMRKLDLELLRFQQNTMAPVVDVAAIPVPVLRIPKSMEYYTVEAVANYYSLFRNIHTLEQEVRIVKEVTEVLRDGRYALTAMGYLPDISGEPNIPHFESSDVCFVKAAIEDSTRDVLASGTGNN